MTPRIKSAQKERDLSRHLPANPRKGTGACPVIYQQIRAKRDGYRFVALNEMGKQFCGNPVFPVS